MSPEDLASSAREAEKVFADHLLLTAAELAERLKLSTRTLRRWRSEGKGPPFVRVGRGVRYDWGEVKEWMSTKTP